MRLRLHCSSLSFSSFFFLRALRALRGLLSSFMREQTTESTEITEEEEAKEESCALPGRVWRLLGMAEDSCSGSQVTSAPTG